MCDSVSLRFIAKILGMKRNLILTIHHPEFGPRPRLTSRTPTLLNMHNLVPIYLFPSLHTGPRTLLREGSFSSGLWDWVFGSPPRPWLTKWPVGNDLPRCGRHWDSNKSPPAPKTHPNLSFRNQLSTVTVLHHTNRSIIFDDQPHA